MPRFSQMPTLGEFIDRASKYGYVLRHVAGVVDIATDQPEIMEYLWRERDRIVLELPKMPKRSRLTRAEVESLCKRCGIPLDDFFGPEDFLVVQ